ncbi:MULTISPECIES: hypothetical protein [Epilithonimonas]|uniref:TIGR02646 family protein n=2 Tax=Epilithonimonas TaxID=2782229 RepID=A0A3N0XAT1_9FLAO|nr:MULTISPECIES: hypothetical protein [Epilithonimonas]AZI55166.1 hypothetical protein EIB75_07885 [Epilithonimonas vandammei]ROI14484.1 hypothetical protein EGH73_02620 [Epilithonimonas hominis]HAP95447.1 hypothetical protein [Chryseobacterium sp.]
MAIDFRTDTPQRTCKKTFANYRSFKPYLRTDFRKKCGYTDCSDFWFGGPKTFHIDHFKPKSKFPELETSYSNLVYCCSYVNVLKSDDENEYLDPCDVNFNEHFDRDNDGNIFAMKGSATAVYMHKSLKLFLKRYQIIWALDKLIEKIDLLGDVIEKNVNVSNEVKDEYINLNIEFHKYRNFLSKEQ